MRWTPPQATALALVLAIAGSCAAASPALAQATGNPGQGVVGAGTSPALDADEILQPTTMADDHGKDANGPTSVGSVGATINPYAPTYSEADHTTGSPLTDATGYDKDKVTAYEKPTPNDKYTAGDKTTSAPDDKYSTHDRDTVDYDSAGTYDDVSPAYVTEDPYKYSRERATLRARRLTVFAHEKVGGRSLIIKPYIEAGVVTDQYVAPDSDNLTYTMGAAGVDALINGRNNQGMVSLRVERRQNIHHTNDGTLLSGMAHGSSAVVSDALWIDYGGYANREEVSPTGGLSSAGTGNSVAHIYSGYVGPSLLTSIGDAAVSGHYRIGYTGVTSPGTAATSAGANGVDVFDHSTVQDARLAVNTRPGDVAPVGLGLDGAYHDETISNLDQRVRDLHVRAEVIVPVTDETALVGGIGYEHADVTSHDAKRNPDGTPVIDANGRFVTDYSSPRYIAYRTDGLVWDAGVLWRPSTRTNLEVHVGRRYGSFGGYGTFTYAPDERQSFNVVVYDDLAGFGGSLTNSLSSMPNQFEVVRDAITGDVTNCVASGSSGNCLMGVLGSINSAVYRSRGVSAVYTRDFGRMQGGLAIGYDRRRYITSSTTILAGINGKSDQYYWMAAYLTGHVSARAMFKATVDAYHFDNGLAKLANATGIRAGGVYEYLFTRHLSGSLSMAVDGITRQTYGDLWDLSMAAGVRYTF